jgi:hypothetical protein
VARVSATHKRRKDFPKQTMNEVDAQGEGIFFSTEEAASIGRHGAWGVSSVGFSGCVGCVYVLWVHVGVLLARGPWYV